MANSDQAMQELALLLARGQRGAYMAQQQSNNLQPTYGTIVDTKDPEQRGRVKVILDETNPELLTEQGYPQGDNQAPQTFWIEPQIPQGGDQPEALKNKRVPIIANHGDPNKLFFGDPVFDPEETAKAAQPENSAMTRLPVYPSGSLPFASAENIGCMVVEQDGPLESDWLCVCLKRQGEYIWVRHVDLAHGHAGENDGKQPPDTDGDGEAPVEEQTVWDYVFPTSKKPMEKKTAYGTDPRPNPYGDEAKWHEPPGTQTKKGSE